MMVKVLKNILLALKLAHFGPFLALKWVLDNYLVIANNIINHNMQNRQNLMHFELLKWLRTSFWPIFGPNWPIFGPTHFFFKNPKTSLF